MVLDIKATTDIPFQELEVKDARFSFPIGLHLGDRLYRHFTLREITGRHELIMGRIEADHYDPERPSTLFAYTRKLLKKILITAIDEIEDIELNDLLKDYNISSDDLINRMYLADVIALFINFRIGAYGQNMMIGGQCPCPRREKIKPREEDAHDLNTILLRCYTGDDPPIYRFWLNEAIGDIEYIELNPPLFIQLNNLIGENVENEPVFYRLLKTCCSNPYIEEIYLKMNRHDRIKLKKIIPKINIFGPDKAIAMDCPYCNHQWDSPLLNGYNYENFYLTLLNIPRVRKIYAGENPAQLLLDKIAFFLSTGEQAPFSSADAVYDLTVSSRQFWVDELSKTYEKQREDMKKSQASSKKSGGYRRNRK